MWFIGVEVEQETSVPPPKKNPGSAPVGSPLAAVFKSQIQKKRKYEKSLFKKKTICNTLLGLICQMPLLRWLPRVFNNYSTRARWI